MKTKELSMPRINFCDLKRGMVIWGDGRIFVCTTDSYDSKYIATLGMGCDIRYGDSLDIGYDWLFESNEESGVGINYPLYRIK